MMLRSTRPDSVTHAKWVFSRRSDSGCLKKHIWHLKKEKNEVHKNKDFNTYFSGFLNGAIGFYTKATPNAPVFVIFPAELNVWRPTA